MAGRTRPPPAGPRARGERGGEFTKTSSEQSLDAGLAARLSHWGPGVPPPTHKFPRQTRRRRGNPATRARRPGRLVKARPAGPHTGSRGSRERKARPYRLPTSQEGAGGAGSGRGRPAGGQHPRSPECVFAFGPDRGEDGGRCSLGSGRKSACGGRGRAAGLPGGGRGPGAARTTNPYSAAAAATRSRLHASQAPRVLEQAEGLRLQTRGDLRAPPRPAGRPPTRPPSAPRACGMCARPACVELPGTRRPLGRPFVYFQRAHLSAPLPPPPPALPLTFPWRWL